jgi:hypothetical protein
LVKWVGYDQPSWEPDTNMTGAKELVEDFHRAYPDKPAPTTAPFFSTTP